MYSPQIQEVLELFYKLNISKKTAEDFVTDMLIDRPNGWARYEIDQFVIALTESYSRLQEDPNSLSEILDSVKPIPFYRPPFVYENEAREIFSDVLVNWSATEITRLASAVLKAKRTEICHICKNRLSGSSPCNVCASRKRDKTTICVVDDERSQAAIEKSGEFDGVYHVLGGVITPLDGVGIYDSNIFNANLEVKSLLTRIQNTEVEEIIIAIAENNVKRPGDRKFTIDRLTSLLERLVPKLSLASFSIPASIDELDPRVTAIALKNRQTITTPGVK